MTKKEMAEEILQSSSAIGVSETRFYKNVSKQPKGWIERCYNAVVEAKTESEKKWHADYAMRYFQ